MTLDKLKYQYGLDLAAPYLDGPRILDVGTGTGLFVRVARDSGYEPVALELHRQNVEKLRNDGFQVIDRPLEAAGIKDNSFDLVTMWEVLEHIVNPRSLLLEIHRILKKNGTLFILVPNADSLVTRILQEKSGTFGGHSHVNFFNTDNLSRILEDTGFNPLEMETIITELGTINNHLALQDPYLGQSEHQLDFLTPKAIHSRLLGSKLLVIAGREKSEE
jgi:2-polyprenyl-3-methyl-5-hydroxy-6-metoxy-1,4-benzoquinol methylase